jgi:hypothetical protein
VEAQTVITEKEFMKQVIVFARLRGWLVAHFRPARTAKGWCTAVEADGQGFPDLVLVRSSEILFVECKRSEKEKPTPEQRKWLLALATSGCRAMIWSPEDWPTIERVLG